MFATVEEILQELREKKRPFILVDSDDRENEGDIVVPVDIMTKEVMNFAITHCRGVPCVTITQALCNKLGLELLTRSGFEEEGHVPRFVTTIEAKHGITTGISAADRNLTMKLLVDDNIDKNQFITPGHVFPIMVDPMGLKGRQGHTEGSVTLCVLAGFKPVAMICEILDEDGDPARLNYLTKFAPKHGLKITTIQMLQAYVLQKNLDISF